MPIPAKRGRPRKVPPPVKPPVLSTQVPFDWPGRIMALVKRRANPITLSLWMREALLEKMAREEGES